MYDVLRARYTFPCPTWGEARVALSDFRTVERLPGAVHPAIYRVHFACGCGEEHDGLVSHDQLDWAPLGLGEGEFFDLMTARAVPVGVELASVAATRIGAGDWPWSFFCYPEERTRPAFPSSFSLLAPGDGRKPLVGMAVRCPACRSLSVNLVSRAHLDVPFHNDVRIGVVRHLFPDDALRTIDDFRRELYSADFDECRLALG